MNEERRSKVGVSLLDLEPSAILELYELYFDINQPAFKFHSGTNNLTRNIIWNGEEYFATSVEVEGFEANMMNRLPRPRVTVANTDYAISNILRDYSDFRNSKFVRVKVFLKYLDAVNFEENTNPFGQPDPLAFLSKERYLVSQKLFENKALVQFELITPFDLQSLEVATRSIYGRYCYWQYRGAGCGYQGDLICKDNDADFKVSPARWKSQFIRDSSYFFNGSLSFEETVKKFKWTLNKRYESGDIVYVSNIDFNGYKDPPKTFFVCIRSHVSSESIVPNKSFDYWEKDGCSKSLEACKKRFKDPFYIGNDYIAYNDSDLVKGVLPFGGFPGTDRFQYER